LPDGLSANEVCPTNDCTYTGSESYGGLMFQFTSLASGELTPDSASYGWTVAPRLPPGSGFPQPSPSIVLYGDDFAGGSSGSRSPIT